jgi:imidazoleglycerol-phosphate dehydratase
MSKSPSSVRYAEVDRSTSETEIQVVLDLDGANKIEVSTGIGFLDHMLQLFAYHSRISLGIKAEGDYGVDDHHTAEDVGICLGQALRKALYNSGGIERYGQSLLPMDEALVLVALDISGRGVLGFEVAWKRERLGSLATENVREFLRAFTSHAGVTLHVRKLAGENDHHVCEAIFKGLGRALRAAIEPTGRGDATSTKGVID